ncbi:hypothetical protein GPJ56_009560 [Histomonas meleagridis]|uniref:uncharacterized protein n=1 Tax=Histomonas meleagridis TaxID=135588 RepID=UPI00355A4B44|nr:hypothetical protein GPJ56_009560 [Histomonas meleagridis]KAH0797159.1 hypothetical protein GO595_010017 [Histomonas meleagridis]
MADTMIMKDSYDGYINLTGSEERKYGQVAFAFTIICLILYAFDLIFNFTTVAVIWMGEDTLPEILACCQKGNSKYLRPICGLILLIMICLAYDRTSEEHKQQWLFSISQKFLQEYEQNEANFNSFYALTGLNISTFDDNFEQWITDDWEVRRNYRTIVLGVYIVSLVVGIIAAIIFTVCVAKIAVDGSDSS